jgi:hypothetical protein
VNLTRDQVAQADLRLAYVQHPFPAQGTTTDTTHLIVGDAVTREGAYVGLTRARERTTTYAADEEPERIDSSPLIRLAERMSRSEPTIPSIHLPLQHEEDINRRSTEAHSAAPRSPLVGPNDLRSDPQGSRPVRNDPPARGTWADADEAVRRSADEPTAGDTDTGESLVPDSGTQGAGRLAQRLEKRPPEREPERPTARPSRRFSDVSRDLAHSRDRDGWEP